MAVGSIWSEWRKDAFVTAGNTGAATVTAYFRLGTIPGVERPALAPVQQQRFVCRSDVGQSRLQSGNLFQLRSWGRPAEKVRKVKPLVGLISNGEEAGKGSQLVKDTYPLLKGSNLNFYGNVEGKEVIGGEVDVAVTDGFTGNVMLKSSEAVAKLLTDKIKEMIKSGPITAKIGGVLVKPTLKKLKKLMDPSEEGAAPLLGINGLVFIGHGRSDSNAIKNAIRVAKEAAEAGVLDSIKLAIEQQLAGK
jgi:glycerol-3-phosphate acyltransferase PlsX